MSSNYFISFTTTPTATTASANFLSTLGVVVTRKSGEPSGEDSVKITSSSDIATYTDDTLIGGAFDAGLKEMLLIFEDTFTVTTANIYNATIGCIVKSPEATVDLKLLPATYVGAGFISTTNQSDSQEIGYAATKGRGVFYTEDATQDQMYSFLGKLLFLAGLDRMTGQTFSSTYDVLDAVGDSATAETLADINNYSFFLKENNIVRVGMAKVGGISIFDHFAQALLEINLSNKFNQFKTKPGGVAYTDIEIGALEALWQQEIDRMVQLNQLALGSGVNIPRRTIQSLADIQNFILNNISVTHNLTGAIFRAKINITEVN